MELLSVGCFCVFKLPNKSERPLSRSLNKSLYGICMIMMRDCRTRDLALHFCGVLSYDCAWVAPGCLCDIYIIKTRVKLELCLVSRVAASSYPFWRSTNSTKPSVVWPAPALSHHTPWSMTHIYDYFHDAFGAETFPSRTLRKVEKYEKGSGKAKAKMCEGRGRAAVFFLFIRAVGRPKKKKNKITTKIVFTFCFIYLIDHLGLRLLPIFFPESLNFSQLCAKLSFLYHFALLPNW